MAGEGERVFRNMYKGHMDKPKGVGSRVGSGGGWGGGGVVGGKWRQLYLNNNNKMCKKRNRFFIKEKILILEK